MTLLSGPALPKLTELILKDNVSAQDLKIIISTRKNSLKTIRIESNRRNMNIIVPILAQCPNLNSLFLEGGFPNFLGLSLIKSLTVLTLNIDFAKIIEANWTKLDPKSLPNLLELNLKWIGWVRPVKWDREALLLNLSSACPNLNILTFHNENSEGDVTEEQLIEIARNCPELKTLVIHNHNGGHQLDSVLDDFSRMQKLCCLDLYGFAINTEKCKNFMKRSKQIKALRIGLKIYARTRYSPHEVELNLCFSCPIFSIVKRKLGLKSVTQIFRIST